jgi:hypothetical protein
VARVTLRSTGRQDVTTTEFHDLEFGLSLPQSNGPEGGNVETDGSSSRQGPGEIPSSLASNMFQRSNVAVQHDGIGQSDLWKLVPGDLVASWRSGYFDTRNQGPTKRQMEERNFYIPCSRCGRLESQIKAEGPIEGCRGSCGAKIDRHGIPIRAIPGYRLS